MQELCRVMFDALEKRFKKDQDRQGQAQVCTSSGEDGWTVIDLLISLN